MGKWLILIGILFIIAGLAVHFGLRLSWLGKLPGDISWQSGNTKVYIPITSSLLISLLISLIIYLFRLLTR